MTVDIDKIKALLIREARSYSFNARMFRSQDRATQPETSFNQVLRASALSNVLARKALMNAARRLSNEQG